MVTINTSWNLDESIRNFLDISLLGASIVDPEGVIVYVNTALAELFQTTTGSMVGKLASDYYADPSVRFPIINELLKNKQVKDRMVELKRENGSTYHASLSFFLSEYAGVDHYFCLFYDLTERLTIEAESKLKAKNEARIEHLEKLVELGRHTADQINNPLTIIQGLYHVIKSELNKEHPDSAKIEVLNEKIESAIQRIAQSVSDLNKVSKR